MPTIETVRESRELKELMHKIKLFLKEGFKGEVQEPKALIKYYWEASLKAEQLITMVFGKEGGFPIDIETLAEKLGIRLVLENLNEFPGWRSMNRKIGQIEIVDNLFTDEKMNMIYIDKEVPPFSKRYAIAHELAHYIMHYDDADYYEDYCIMPMCPKNVEEIVADIFATFLLIPVRYFFEEFLFYVKRRRDEGRGPVTTEKWIQYLAERSMISEYYVAYGYQQLRYVAYWIYRAWNEEKNEAEGEKDIEVEMTPDEREKVQAETKDYYTEEMGELLFE